MSCNEGCAIVLVYAGIVITCFTPQHAWCAIVPVCVEWHCDNARYAGLMLLLSNVQVCSHTVMFTLASVLVSAGTFASQL